MNRGRLIVIGGGLVLVALIGLLGWYTLTRSSTTYGTDYTDSISNETFTVPTTSVSEKSDGDDTPAVTKNQIVITGLDTFFGTIEESQRQNILDELTAFIRARVGAHPARAGALNADVQQIGSNPTRYRFTLVLVNPASRYSVIITVPDSGELTSATLEFGEVTP